MAGYGRFVGRVGTLALVLGVGMAVADGCGVASADPISGAHHDAGATAESSPARGTANPESRNTKPRSVKGVRPQLNERWRATVAEMRDEAPDSLEDLTRQSAGPSESAHAGAVVRSRAVTGRLRERARGESADAPIPGTGAGSVLNRNERVRVRPARAVADAPVDTAVDQAVVDGSGQLQRAVTTLEPAPGATAGAEPTVAEQLVGRRSSVAPAAAFLSPAAAAPSSPATVVASLMSAVGLGTFTLPSAPAGPRDTPLMWAMLAWVRRQSALAFAGQTATVPAAAVAAADYAAAAPNPEFIEIEVGADEYGWGQGQLAVSPDGRYAYVITQHGQQLSIIDTQTNAVVATTQTEGGRVTVGPSGSAVYVTNVSAAQSDTYDIDAYDATTGEYLGRISVPEVENDYPAGFHYWVGDLAISNDESTIYTTVRQQARYTSDSTLKVVAYNRYTQESTIVDLGPLAPGASLYAGPVALSPDGSRLYVPVTPVNGAETSYDPGIAIIDTETGEIKDFLTNRNYASHVVVSPDGEHLYMLSEDTNANTMHVTVLTPDDRTTANVVTLPSDLLTYGDIAISADGSTLYIATRSWENQNNDFDQIVAVDLVAGTYGEPVTFTGSTITELTASPDGTRLYATGYDMTGYVGGEPMKTGVWVFDATSIPTSGAGSGGGPSTEVPESPTLTAIREQAQRLADAIRAATNHQDRPRVPDAQNNQAEVDWEKNWEVFNLYVGWIPGVSTVLNAISLAVDFQDARQAWIDGDAEGFQDEANDLFGDVVGLIPVLGGPVSYFIQYMFALADELDSSLASTTSV